jgi:hypothetical protein
VEQIIELRLADEEQAKFSQSIAVISQYRASALMADGDVVQSAMISCGERVTSASRVASGRWLSVTITLADNRSAQIGGGLAADQHPVALPLAAQVAAAGGAWRAIMVVFPSFSPHQGISMLWAEPVTGSSGTLLPGRRSG